MTTALRLSLALGTFLALSTSLEFKAQLKDIHLECGEQSWVDSGSGIHLCTPSVTRSLSSYLSPKPRTSSSSSDSHSFFFQNLSSLLSNSPPQNKLPLQLSPPRKTSFYGALHPSEQVSFLVTMIPPKQSNYSHHLLWKDLVPKAKHKEGNYLLYSNISLSSEIEGESAITGCIMDIVLLFLEMGHKDFIYPHEKNLFTQFNVQQGEICYLPIALNFFQRSFQHYSDPLVMKDPSMNSYEIVPKTERSIRIITQVISDLCMFSHFDSSFLTGGRCFHPMMHLLYVWLSSQTGAYAPTFVEIASLVSLLPTLPKEKRETWKKYLMFRGLSFHYKTYFPVAFVDKYFFPILRLFYSLALRSKVLLPLPGASYSLSTTPLSPLSPYTPVSGFSPNRLSALTADFSDDSSSSDYQTSSSRLQPQSPILPNPAHSQSPILSKTIYSHSLAKPSGAHSNLLVPGLPSNSKPFSSQSTVVGPDSMSTTQAHDSRSNSILPGNQSPILSYASSLPSQHHQIIDRQQENIEIFPFSTSPISSEGPIDSYYEKLKYPIPNNSPLHYQPPSISHTIGTPLSSRLENGGVVQKFLKHNTIDQQYLPLREQMTQAEENPFKDGKIIKGSRPIQSSSYLSQRFGITNFSPTERRSDKHKHFVLSKLTKEYNQNANFLRRSMKKATPLTPFIDSEPLSRILSLHPLPAFGLSIDSTDSAEEETKASTVAALLDQIDISREDLSNAFHSCNNRPLSAEAKDWNKLMNFFGVQPPNERHLAEERIFLEAFNLINSLRNSLPPPTLHFSPMDLWFVMEKQREIGVGLITSLCTGKKQEQGMETLHKAASQYHDFIMVYFASTIAKKNIELQKQRLNHLLNTSLRSLVLPPPTLPASTSDQSNPLEDLLKKEKLAEASQTLSRSDKHPAPLIDSLSYLKKRLSEMLESSAFLDIQLLTRNGDTFKEFASRLRRNRKAYSTSNISNVESSLAKVKEEIHTLVHTHISEQDMYKTLSVLMRESIMEKAISYNQVHGMIAENLDKIKTTLQPLVESYPILRRYPLKRLLSILHFLHVRKEQFCSNGFVVPSIEREIWEEESLTSSDGYSEWSRLQMLLSATTDFSVVLFDFEKRIPSIESKPLFLVHEEREATKVVVPFNSFQGTIVEFCRLATHLQSNTKVFCSLEIISDIHNSHSVEYVDSMSLLLSSYQNVLATLVWMSRLRVWTSREDSIVLY